MGAPTWSLPVVAAGGVPHRTPAKGGASRLDGIGLQDGSQRGGRSLPLESVAARRGGKEGEGCGCTGLDVLLVQGNNGGQASGQV